MSLKTEVYILDYCRMTSIHNHITSVGKIL